VAVPPVPSHERPIFVVLPSAAAVADAFLAVLSSSEVRAFALPPVWELDFGGADPIARLAGVRRLELENLARAIAWCLEVATPERFEASLARDWAELPDGVREFFLKRSAVATFAALLKVGKPSRAFAPPPSFATDRVRAARFEAAYRLEREAGTRPSDPAPAEEASLVLYPFDVLGRTSREEAGLAAGGSEAVLEAFAYEAGRARHRAFLARALAGLRAKVVDPLDS
jgi:hypothetical protein